MFRITTSTRSNMMELCGPSPLCRPDLFNHKCTRFKAIGWIDFWSLLPPSYCHIFCEQYNVEWSLGRLFPGYYPSFPKRKESYLTSCCGPYVALPFLTYLWRFRASKSDPACSGAKDCAQVRTTLARKPNSVWIQSISRKLCQILVAAAIMPRKFLDFRCFKTTITLIS